MDFLFNMAVLVFGIMLGIMLSNDTLSADQINRSQLTCAKNGGVREMRMRAEIVVVCADGAIFHIIRSKP